MAKTNFTKIAKEVIETEIQSLKKLKKNIKNSFNEAVQAILNCKKGMIIVSGVGKSGSPTLRLITSIPAARSSAAFAAIASVAEGVIRPILSDNIGINKIMYSWNQEILD